MISETIFIIDFRSTIASMCLLKLTNTFRDMDIGQELKIIVQDQDTISDIFKLLPADGYELRDMQNEASDYIIIVKKTRR